MKTGIALLLTLVFLCGLLAACGENAGTDTESDTAAPPTASDTADVSDGEASDVPKEERTLESVFAAADHFVGLTDQGNSRLVVYDLSVSDWTSPDAVVWEYRDDYYAANAAGIKFRHNDLLGGDVVLFCGPNGAGIVSYATKELLFFSDDIPVNPHTVELLPDGTFLCGGTQGKAIHAYNPLAGKTGRRTAKLDVPDGHGCLWDPEYDMLWTSGANNIDSYAVSGGPEKPTFTKIYSYGNLPSSIHDLSPVYGDVTKLWFTCGEGILQLDKETGAYSRAYSGAAYAGDAGAPAVGSFPDGMLVWVVPNGCRREWNTDRLSMYVSLDGTKFKKMTYENKSDAYYKCRVWISDYQ